MRYLLDTCVVSALRTSADGSALVKWISEIDESDLYLSAITIGELEFGINLLPDSKKRTTIAQWARHSIARRFGDRILPIDAAVAARWGELLAELDGKGKPMPVLDGLIAATALANDCTVVTSYTKDFAQCGVPLLNP